MTKPAEKIMRGLREAVAHARGDQLASIKLHLDKTKLLHEPKAKGTRGAWRTGVAPRRPRS